MSLGEGFTPLLRARRLGDKLGLPNLYLKDESQNPTGSFKARGMAVAVSKAHELGIRKLAVPSAGNAGGALAAYAAKAGMEAAIFMPEGTPLANRLECALHGAKVTLVPGSIKDCGRVMCESLQGENWFDVSTLREPYRVEGKKTMAYEVYEQMGGRLPDAMIYPTGGGTGLIGMWKAFDEMHELGWIADRRPRMFAIQAHGCAPMVRAYAEGTEHAEEWKDPQTLASGLRVPAANWRLPDSACGAEEPRRGPGGFRCRYAGCRPRDRRDRRLDHFARRRSYPGGAEEIAGGWIPGRS